MPEPPAVAPAPALPNEASPQAIAVPPASSPRDTQQALIPPPVPAKKPPAPPAHNQTVTAPVEPDTPASPSPLNLQLGEGGGDKYLNSVRDEILRHVFYPPTAELFHWSGTPVYRLTIDRRGRLVRLVLLETSGYDILDNAVAKAILASAPFGPPPLSLLGSYDTISGRLYLTLPAQ
jgi:protein TonB